MKTENYSWINVNEMMSLYRERIKNLSEKQKQELLDNLITKIDNILKKLEKIKNEATNHRN